MPKVVFQVHHLYYLPQFLPVAAALQQDGNFQVVFSPVMLSDRTDYDLSVKILQELNYPILTGRSESDRIKRLLAHNFDVTIFGKAAHAERYCSPSTLAVLLYHGVGFKRCYYTDFSPRLNVRYIEGQYRLQELLKYGYKIDYVVTGFPKLDVLQQAERQQIIDRLGLDAERPTILYAPTFYPSSIELVSDELAKISQGYNLIVKLHHFSWLLPKYRHQRSLWQELAHRYQHIRLLPVEEYNIVPYFLVSDVLLTDGSSTAFEFLAVEKPVIRFTFYKLRWKHRLFPGYFQKRLDQAIESELEFAYQLSGLDDLERALTTALSDTANKRALLPKYKEKLLGKVDGQAAQRVVADLKRRLKI
jgi:hypothetical protein